jgi:hypothetical protein
VFHIGTAGAFPCPDIVSSNMSNYIDASTMAVHCGGDLRKCVQTQESGTNNLTYNKTHSGHPHLNPLPKKGTKAYKSLTLCPNKYYGGRGGR